MAWNEPGKGNGDKDPWGNRNDQNGPPDLDDMLKKLWGQISGGGKKRPGSTAKSQSPFTKFTLYAALIVIAVIYTGYGFYTVDEKERAVILRFGAYHATVGAGLHWAPPLIDQPIKVDISSIQRTSVDATMLTKDENIVIVRLGVQYRIENPEDYLFNVTSPEDTITEATESALRQVVGNSVMDQIITTGREQIKAETLTQLQETMEPYATGLQISQLTLEEATPPSQVKAAFDDAIKAREDEERQINTAQTYENRVVPVAEGNAARTIEAARAYEQSIIAQANGDVAKFNKLLPEYNAAPEVTRQRLYLETMERLYSKVNKVLIDVDGGNNMIYLPIDQLMKQQRNSQSTGSDNR
ncbi:MAG: FtsH protease activity modulator HflK [Gammaproteobacteria bacterium]|jgi:membrane protease subunit HflK